MADLAAGDAPPWRRALSIRTVRGRTAVLYLVVVLAAAALGASLTATSPIALANAGIDLLCIIVLVATWVWVESEVVRPAKVLAEVARAFNHGGDGAQSRERANADARPISLWASADTFAEALNEQNSKADDAIAVERVVLREVNHRIRNNLQMVSSILAIQARVDEGEGAVRAHDRIKLLSLAHDRIYASGDVHDVRLDDLAAEIGRSLLSVRGARRIQLDAALFPARVSSDSAVPMAFLMGESLAHALNVLAPVGEAVLLMALRTEPDGSIVFALSSASAPDHRSVLPNARRIMEAFARQVGAEIICPASGAEIVRVTLTKSADSAVRQN